MYNEQKSLKISQLTCLTWSIIATWAVLGSRYLFLSSSPYDVTNTYKYKSILEGNAEINFNTHKFI